MRTLKSSFVGLSVLVLLNLMGCGDIEDAKLDEQETGGQVDNKFVALSSRPLLSSICGFRCNNSHFASVCGDQRKTGQVNVSIFPLLENATTVPSSILGTTVGWASTSCPNCQWQLQGVTTRSGGPPPSVKQATNDVNMSQTVKAAPEYDWQGTAVLRIWDPTDASVGTCTLSVGVGLSGGIRL